jgi:glycosyltransferase involved in cell wall biosynthesis
MRSGVIIDPDSEVAVHLTTGETFEPIPGKYNILYTMYECTSIPDNWISKINKADLIVVPCKHNKYLFEKYTKKPVEVCLEGVEVDKYTFVERSFPDPLSADNPFTYLWCGATNPRKGTEHMIEAWERFNLHWFKKDRFMRKKFRLVMKTTQETDRETTIEIEYRDRMTGKSFFEEKKKENLPAERIISCGGNAIVDTRRLPIVISGGEPDHKTPRSMVEIYHYAHCFVFPTMGEGFGLTLAEAMSTGLPCLTTMWSGPRDFCDDANSYSIDFGFKEVRAVKPGEDGRQKITHVSTAANPDVDHIVRRMLQVFYDYEKALRKGRRASETIRKRFTWDISARRLIEIIEKYTQERIAA